VVSQQLFGALLTVDDDEYAVHRRARLAERFDGVDRGLPGRGDVLQYDDLLALVESSFDAVAGAVPYFASPACGR